MSQNSENVVVALEEFRKSFEDIIFHTPSEDDDNAKVAISKALTVPDILSEYARTIAKTGRVEHSWSLVKPLFLTKLDWVMHDYNARDPFDEVPLMPNSPHDSFKDLYRTIMAAAYSFTQAPFTVQRLFELISNPDRHYRRVDKFMRALEKSLNIVTTVDSKGRKLSASGMLPPSPIINGRPSGKLPACLSSFYRWQDYSNITGEPAVTANHTHSSGPLADAAEKAADLVPKATHTESVTNEMNVSSENAAQISGSTSAESVTENTGDDLSMSSLDEVPSISEEVSPVAATCIPESSTRLAISTADNVKESETAEVPEVFISESSTSSGSDSTYERAGVEPSDHRLPATAKRPREASDSSEEGLESEKRPKLGSGGEAGDADISSTAPSNNDTPLDKEDPMMMTTGEPSPSPDQVEPKVGDTENIVTKAEESVSQTTKSVSQGEDSVSQAADSVSQATDSLAECQTEPNASASSGLSSVEEDPSTAIEAVSSTSDDVLTPSQPATELLGSDQPISEQPAKSDQPMEEGHADENQPIIVSSSSEADSLLELPSQPGSLQTSNADLNDQRDFKDDKITPAE